MVLLYPASALSPPEAASVRHLRFHLCDQHEMPTRRIFPALMTINAEARPHASIWAGESGEWLYQITNRGNDPAAQLTLPIRSVARYC
jgi:hypothetical protein